MNDHLIPTMDDLIPAMGRCHKKNKRTRRHVEQRIYRNERKAIRVMRRELVEMELEDASAYIGGYETRVNHRIPQLTIIETCCDRDATAA